jgi:formate C-acetyltransferase
MNSKSKKPTSIISSFADEVQKRKTTIRPINKRIEKLRNQSITAPISISNERAKLITQFYKQHSKKQNPIPIQRALAFKYLMENISLPIENNQLIVGIRGTGPKEVPTYPEICCHSLQDLALLSSREKNPYHTTQETIDLYQQQIIPYWQTKTIKNQIFNKIKLEWQTAYNSGIFTEFMEQRVPGHTAGGSYIFRTGLTEIKEKLKQKKPQTTNEQYEKKAMEIVADAIIHYAHRYAKKLVIKAKNESNSIRKKELLNMARICHQVPEHPPQTFWEALQHYWFIHVGILIESNPWDAFTPGRLDQHLNTFYQHDLKTDQITREQAKELLEAFWLKFNNQPAPPKVGITAQESNTYNDFTKINIGGLTPERTDASNDISYLILEVLSELRTIQPNTAVLISKKTPYSLLNKSLEAISQGFGEPPLFNFENINKILQRQGKTPVDSNEGGCSGCIETGAFGKESYILTGYLNLPKILEITLNNGIDPITKEKIGIQTGNPNSFSTFNELFSAFTKQLQYFIKIKNQGNDIIEEIYATEFPVPFLSLWIEDCVDKLKDYNAGGARYNTQYIQMVGLGTLTDSLSSLKKHVFDNNSYTLSDIINVLHSDFENNEITRQLFINRTPHFGNDDDYVDSIAQSIFNTCIDICEDYSNTPIRNASRRTYFLPTTCHVYFGQVCQASADGRKAFTPLSEGISPVQGLDRKGITAVLKSISKLNHEHSGGTLLNQRLSPDLIQNSKSRKKFEQLIRVYFKMGCHHVQFNIVSTKLLREAQNRPEDFQDLMVRVAGYSDYFVNLPKGLQEEIIARTEQST